MQGMANKLSSSVIWLRISGLLVVFNLILNIAQTQAVPNGESKDSWIFDCLDVTFTSVRALSCFKILVNSHVEPMLLSWADHD